MLIKNLLLYKTSGEFQIGDLACSGKIFVEPTLFNQENVLDGSGLYAIPGLIDLHLHGALGGDASDGSLSSLEKMARYELTQGVTSICPTTMTLPVSDLKKAMKTIGEAKKNFGERSARILGINMEGPFISSKKKGAQKEENILPPSLEIFRELNEASGNNIKLVDLAPEIEGALQFIEATKNETRLSLAHTKANYVEALKAFQAGARQVTHLFNAMPPFHHREPGLIGAALDSPDVKCELICDGVHCHEAAVRASFKMFGYERLILISDSMRATGLADGQYNLGGQEVNVQGNEARLKDGTIAGSVTNLMSCVKKAVAFGIPLAHAIYSASTNPALALGLENKFGSLEPGTVADFVLLDGDLNIKAVYKEGKLV